MVFPSPLARVPLRLLTLALPFATGPLSAQDEVDFAKDVRPIFERRCWECHGPRKQDGELRLDRRSGVFVEDEDLWVIVPGKLKESYLYERITLPPDDPDFMPAKGDPLTPAQVATLAKWIEQGAAWPESADAPLEVEPAVPTLAIPERSEAERAAEQAALERLAERGALAMRVAANTEAVEVNFSLLGEAVTDDDLALLAGLEKALVWLNLSRTSVTDAGLARLAAFRELRRVHLARTAVSDAGLAPLRDLARLEYLNLYATKVGDAGLRHLAGAKALRKLYLWESAVTAEGVAALKADLPELHADTGDDAQALEAAAEPAKGVEPINGTCPLTGKPVDPQFTTTYHDQVIGFCCANCVEGFKKDPRTHVAKVKEFRPAGEPQAAKAPANAKCPLTGKDVDPAHAVEVEGRVVAFCCPNCLRAYQADPAKYAEALAKVLPKPEGETPAPPAKPVNATCPLANRPVNPQFTTAVDGHLIGFCCANCLKKVQEDPAKYAEALAKVLPKKEGETPAPAPEPEPVVVDPKPVNTTCPISDRPVKAEYVAVHGARTYAFCCPHCVEAFRKDPARYVSK